MRNSLCPVFRILVVMEISTVMRLLAMLVFLNSFEPIHSQTGLINITIDDSSADPLTGVQIFYGLQNQPGTSAGWAAGQDCPNCLAQPDKAQAFDNSWHDSTYSVPKGNLPYAWVTFTGSAVYVMGIIVASIPQTNYSLNNSRLFFQIDGEDQGNYLHVASIGPEIVYSYNALFFAKEDLPYGLHNITIMNGDSSPAPDSLCLLDRIVYTTKSNTTGPEPKEGSGSGATSTTGPSNSTRTPLSSGTNSSAVTSQIPSGTPPISTTPTQSSDSSTDSQIQSNSSGPRHVSTETIIIVVLGFVLLSLVASGIYTLRIRRKRRLEMHAPAVTLPQVPLIDTRDTGTSDEELPTYLESIGVTSQAQSGSSRSVERVSLHTRDGPDSKAQRPGS
ncbi:hypothetical protein SCHPADRAFT_904487 [Schizopora paradoxa]|uniref:Uncharacterized protein n=1 Tax=Schizopora paradoxa TaxID=27342 RepID=A0A0H2RMA0_9AGAM|nr:hypothetical protein SCHPADRAFT_904487 [Schizopora paradoxa]